jgi:hypothetical protein
MAENAADIPQLDTPTPTSSEVVAPWTGRPSGRPYILGAIVTVGLGYMVSMYVGPMFQNLIDLTGDIFPWSENLIIKIYYTVQIAVYMPTLLVAIAALKIFFVRYEISNGRLIYDHGLIFRKHDQIALQRVRDFRVLSPISQRIVGTGTVILISRDETFPTIELGPFTDPLGVEEIIRAAVIAQQNSTGFREFEST